MTSRSAALRSRYRLDARDVRDLADFVLFVSSVRENSYQVVISCYLQGAKYVYVHNQIWLTLWVAHFFSRLLVIKLKNFHFFSSFIQFDFRSLPKVDLVHVRPSVKISPLGSKFLKASSLSDSPTIWVRFPHSTWEFMMDCYQLIKTRSHSLGAGSASEATSIHESCPLCRFGIGVRIGLKVSDLSRKLGYILMRHQLQFVKLVIY